MGYALDLFLDPRGIDEEFHCSICHDVIKEPAMIEGCEHIFCTSCIEEWAASSSNTCPIDRVPIVGLRAPIRGYMNMYNRLQLKCGFDGCGQVSNLGKIEDHYKTCDFNPEAVKPCATNCGAVIKTKDVSNHNCIEYLKQQLQKHKVQVVELNQQFAAMVEQVEQLKGEIHMCKQKLTDKVEALSAKDEAIEELTSQVARSRFLSDEFMTNIHLNKEELKLKNVKQFYFHVNNENGKLEMLSDLYDKRFCRVAVICSEMKINWLTTEMQKLKNDTKSICSYDYTELQNFQNGGIRMMIWNTLPFLGNKSVQVSLVINYEIPDKFVEYLKRIPPEITEIPGSHDNRIIINLVSNEDEPTLKTIQQFFNTYIPEMPSNLLSLI